MQTARKNKLSNFTLLQMGFTKTEGKWLNDELGIAFDTRPTGCELLFEIKKICYNDILHQIVTHFVDDNNNRKLEFKEQLRLERRMKISQRQFKAKPSYFKVSCFGTGCSLQIEISDKCKLGQCEKYNKALLEWEKNNIIEIEAVELQLK